MLNSLRLPRVSLCFFGVSLLLLSSSFSVKPASAQSPPPSSTYYIHQDHLGSIVSITDDTGNPVKQSKYLPYGEEEASNTSINGRVERGYTGQIKDNHTTLSYYNARYYDPVLSRFISADSLADGMNRYAYVGGNPVNAVDPTGAKSRCPKGSKCWLKNRSTRPTQPPPLNLPPSSNDWDDSLAGAAPILTDTDWGGPIPNTPPPPSTMLGASVGYLLNVENKGFLETLFALGEILSLGSLNNYLMAPHQAAATWRDPSSTAADKFWASLNAAITGLTIAAPISSKIQAARAAAPLAKNTLGITNQAVPSRSSIPIPDVIKMDEYNAARITDPGSLYFLPDDSVDLLVWHNEKKVGLREAAHELSRVMNPGGEIIVCLTCTAAEEVAITNRLMSELKPVGFYRTFTDFINSTSYIGFRMQGSSYASFPLNIDLFLEQLKEALYFPK